MPFRVCSSDLLRGVGAGTEILSIDVAESSSLIFVSDFFDCVPEEDFKALSSFSDELGTGLRCRSSVMEGFFSTDRPAGLGGSALAIF